MITTAGVLAATGIRSLKELQKAQDELERHGLIKVKRLADGITEITLLDETGKPMKFPRRGE